MITGLLIGFGCFTKLKQEFLYGAIDGCLGVD